MKKAGILLLFAAPLAAQVPGDSGLVAKEEVFVIQAPAPRYKADGIQRFFLGKDYRQLWYTPATIEVLDLAHFGGGLTPLGRTGGQETKGLRLGTKDGHQYFFRSIDKDPSLTLPEELRGTIANRVVQDQISSANPLAPVVVARLMDATSILHNSSLIVVMPDSPILGEYRSVFAGLMGILEERIGGSGPAAHWHGATEIINSDTLFDRADRSDDDQVDARAFLLARLFDMYIGDWDRHRDQWRWARYDDAVPRKWRPVPLDRDQAFVRFDGFLLGVARPSLPQLVNYGSKYANMAGQMWNGRELDRRFLVGLTREVFDSVGKSLQAAMTDSVIDDAVHTLPPEHYAVEGATLTARLKARRDKLLDATREFYRLLAKEVDVHATDQAEVATIDRNPDGTVTVAVARGGAPTGAPYFTRRFFPDETKDIRLFLGRGNDTATVRGTGGSITVRILGDSGSDRLIDSSSSGRNHFYDADGAAKETEGSDQSDIDRRAYILPPKKTATELPPRDWGHRWQPATWANYGPDLGLFIGGVRTLTYYGFRKRPFASRHRFRAGIATGPWTARVDYLGEWHEENSRVGWTLGAAASGIEVLRFYGLGNETSSSGGDESYYRITQQQYGIAPAVLLPVARRGELQLGPVLKYASTDEHPERYLATVNPYGAGKFGEIGLRMRYRLDGRNRSNAATTGGLLELGGAIYPPWWDVKETFGEVRGEASAYLTPKGFPLNPTLSLRVGGKRVWG
ncbi:MAG TPA: hypothetical protein VMJ30_07370, partial [Gemmatimonadales bacterium]|nr:hypothetical protein [Gemmatimonadales bacterium]